MKARQALKQVVVGISEMYVTESREEVVATYSLGSCVGVTVFDPEAWVGGMIHCMLPLSTIDRDKARVKPCMFTDTGMVALLQAVLNRGGRRENLIVKVAGAAEFLDKKKIFKISERNYTVLRKVLWKNNILIEAEDVGGSRPRTLRLYMDSGTTTVTRDGREETLE